VKSNDLVGPSGLVPSSVGCPAGKLPVGGGIASQDPISVRASYPDGDLWRVIVSNSSGTPAQFWVYAICAVVSN
jgi:hypothetical protein